MGKIITLSQVKKFIQPNTATLVGGSFDLFHIGHLRYLEKASQHGRPLVVIVQTDRMVSTRKGLTRPIINQKHRAQIIAALHFVDYVLVLDKPSHYDGYLHIFQPKQIVFFKENLIYRKRRAREIQKKFPRIKVVFITSGKKVMSTSAIVKKILQKPNFSRIKNPIARRLHELAAQSRAKVGKISAILINKGITIEEAGNTKTEKHAEELILRKAQKANISSAESELYILIPPCIACSELILESKIKKVFYLHPYGNDDGLKLLRENKIAIKKFV